jgi:putative glutamine amidotransferase
LIVGVTARHGHEEWIQKNTHNYLNVLAKHGVIPVVLAPDTPANLPDGRQFHPDTQGRLPVMILTHLDGLILAGGGDVDPKYFGAELNGAEPESIDHRRDELELNLSRQALDADLPILGICRGCQVLNVAAGGGMVQHFDGHRSPKDGTKYHDVALLPGTRLRTLIGQETLAVNTYHHQGMDLASMAPIFTPSGLAWPDSWLVEAYESQQHSWVVGIQWHPERLFELDDAHRRLWQNFVAACRATQTRRQTAVAGQATLQPPPQLLPSP